MEREPNNNFPIFEGVSGSLYVVIGYTPQGYDALDLEKFAQHEEVRVTLPYRGPITLKDLKSVLPRFPKTYAQIVEKYSQPQEIQKK